MEVVEARPSASWHAGAGVCRCVLVVRDSNDNGGGDDGGGEGGVEGTRDEVQSAQL